MVRRGKRILLRNEAQLNFVSGFVPASIVLARRSLSRVSDERPSGALDSPRRARWANCCYFSLDYADVVIDGMLSQSGADSIRLCVWL